MINYTTKTEEFMPVFNGDYKDLSKICFYLYKNEEDALNGVKSGGTGFLVSIPASVNGKIFLYAVTNRHCIDSKALVLRFNRKDNNGVKSIKTQYNNWYYIDNHYDIAVCPIVLDNNIIDFIHLDISYLITQEQIEKQEIDNGEDCFMIGRFVNYMTVVRPAKYIIEILNKPELKKIRDDNNKALINKLNIPQLD